MSDIDSTPSEKRDVYGKVTDAIINAAQGGPAGHLHGGIEGSASLRLADSASRASSACPGGGGMTADVVVINGADNAAPPSLEQAREFARRSKAESTLRGYRSDWREFCAWCEGQGLAPLPASPETVAAYIAECASRIKVGSVQRT